MKRGSKDLCDTISPQGKNRAFHLDQPASGRKPRRENFLSPRLRPWLAGCRAHRRRPRPPDPTPGARAGRPPLGGDLSARARVAGNQGRRGPPHPARRGHARHGPVDRADRGRRAVPQQAAAGQLARGRVVPRRGHAQRVGGARPVRPRGARPGADHRLDPGRTPHARRVTPRGDFYADQHRPDGKRPSGRDRGAVPRSVRHRPAALAGSLARGSRPRAAHAVPHLDFALERPRPRPAGQGAAPRRVFLRGRGRRAGLLRAGRATCGTGRTSSGSC